MSNNQLFIGIDPGSTGAMCLLDPLGNNIAFMKTSNPFKELVEWFNLCRQQGNLRLACIEDVHSLPLVSAKSNFSFGRNLERLHCALEMADMPRELVQPKKWQKLIGLKQGLDKKIIKKETAKIAIRLYPEAEIYGPRGGLLDGRSDALMIAHYCYLTHKL